MRKLARTAGTLLLAAGVLTLVWVIVVWRWQDPFTAIYTHIEQSHLSHEYDQRAQAFRTQVSNRTLAADAAAYRRTLKRGDPVGRLHIPRLGLNMVVVQGTDESSLRKGPGHYIPSALPGQGQLVYVAGHRTTFLAPFAKINDLRVGDPIRFVLPYGTFTYRVTRHFVVPATDLAVLKDHGHELLRLQACHPRFFATHRYIVDARLVSVAATTARAS
jgi:sortase A